MQPASPLRVWLRCAPVSNSACRLPGVRIKPRIASVTYLTPTYQRLRDKDNPTIAALASVCLPLLKWFPTPQIQLRNERNNSQKEIEWATSRGLA
jgi:hypothetical protein